MQTLNYIWSNFLPLTEFRGHIDRPVTHRTNNRAGPQQKQTRRQDQAQHRREQQPHQQGHGHVYQSRNIHHNITRATIMRQVLGQV